MGDCYPGVIGRREVDPTNRRMVRSDVIEPPLRRIDDEHLLRQLIRIGHTIGERRESVIQRRLVLRYHDN